MSKASVKWFEEVFGVPLERMARLPTVRLDELRDTVITFVDDSPRVVRTRWGLRAMVTVEIGGEQKRLFLSRVALAAEVARLQLRYGSLKGLKVKVRELPKRGRIIPYELQVIEEARERERR